MTNKQLTEEQFLELWGENDICVENVDNGELAFIQEGVQRVHFRKYGTNEIQKTIQGASLIREALEYYLENRGFYVAASVETKSE